MICERTGPFSVLRWRVKKSSHTLAVGEEKALAAEA